MNRLEAFISGILPWHEARHALVALLIMLAVWPFFGLNAGAMAGAFFYIGREVRDREKLGAWDWPGLIAPVAAMALVLIVGKL